MHTAAVKHTLYDIALHFVVAAVSPYYAFRMITGSKYREGLPERFGRLDRRKTASLVGGPVVWVHAVSVGETKAVLPLVRMLRERHPGLKVAFTTVTRTGHDVAAREGEGLIDSLFYFPLDISWAVKKVIDMVDPDVAVVVEKEIWPNFFYTLRQRSIPLVVVNGTISDKSYRRFRRFRSVFGSVFRMVSFFCARTEDDLKKAVASGVPPHRAATVGNIKFDLAPPRADPEKLDALRSDLGIEPGDLVIVAGSTHKGEEEIVLRVFLRLAEAVPGVKLVLAPRHPERFAEVEDLAHSLGVNPTLRTRGGGGGVVLLDTVGELMDTYSFAHVTLVGGSLVEGIGGHNLLEPAFYGRPVVYGPHLTTYLGMAEMLEEAGGGMRVADETDLYRKLKHLLTDEVKRKRTGTAARRVVEANRGASERTVEVIERFLDAREAERSSR